MVGQAPRTWDLLGPLEQDSWRRRNRGVKRRSSGRGGSGELGERSRSRTVGLLRIQARQMGYSGVFSLN